jgi:small subunit ribosomal protein S17
MPKKERIGVVVSTAAEKTIIVAIQTRYQHEKYSKTLIKTKRYMAHDEQSNSQCGDLVLIQESPPISRRKKWILKAVLQGEIPICPINSKKEK